MSEQYPDEPVVVNDRRRIDPETGQVRSPGTGTQPGRGPAGPAGPTGPGGMPGQAGGPGPAGGPAGSPGPGWSAGPAGSQDEVAALAEQLAERTTDLQRVTAEYANYRKRVDRDRQAVVDIATGSVLVALLPVLDDIDRARQHGDLTGAFKSVADQLEATLEKLGLQPAGAVGELFDPTVHEAVAHQVSPDVTEPTAVAVLRRGYKHGERLLRAPLVAVAEPESPADASTEVGGEPSSPLTVEDK